ncbi:hypothetical protein [Methanococcoides vulcani]|uniref:hypothetical protein n=1 Tax=Methanococcoides vulcani TaxID=1353158 RepID=UPI000B8375AC
MDSSTGAFIWTPSRAREVPMVVMFEVTDGELTDSEAIIINVNSVNTAPLSKTTREPFLSLLFT